MKTEISDDSQSHDSTRFGLQDLGWLVLGFVLINMIYEALDTVTATIVVLCIAVAVLTGLVVIQQEEQQ